MVDESIRRTAEKPGFQRKQGHQIIVPKRHMVSKISLNTLELSDALVGSESIDPKIHPG